MEIQRIRIDTGDVIIWQINENLEVLKDNIILTHAEQEYYDSIRAERRQKEWLTSRVMIRKELGENVSTIYDGRKPILIGSSNYISISHSNNLVALFISHNPCGIDIEDYTRNFSRVSNRFLSTKELEYIKDDDIALAWSIKEAAYKLIGILDIDFAIMFTIKSIDNDNRIAIMSYNNRDYSFIFTKYKNYNIVIGTE